MLRAVTDRHRERERVHDANDVIRGIGWAMNSDLPGRLFMGFPCGEAVSRRLTSAAVPQK